MKISTFSSNSMKITKFSTFSGFCKSDILDRQRGWISAKVSKMTRIKRGVTSGVTSGVTVSGSFDEKWYSDSVTVTKRSLVNGGPASWSRVCYCRCTGGVGGYPVYGGTGSRSITAPPPWYGSGHPSTTVSPLNPHWDHYWPQPGPLLASTGTISGPFLDHFRPFSAVFRPFSAVFRPFSADFRHFSADFRHFFREIS